MSKYFLERIIQLVDTQVALASLLNTPDDPIKQAHVWGWLNKTKEGIPAKHVIKACSLVNFQVTPHQLRPDLYPHPEDGLPTEYRCQCDNLATPNLPPAHVVNGATLNVSASAVSE